MMVGGLESQSSKALIEVEAMRLEDSDEGIFFALKHLKKAEKFPQKFGRCPRKLTCWKTKKLKTSSKVPNKKLWLVSPTFPRNKTCWFF